MLDVTDFAANPAPELGGLGVCHVRYGKDDARRPPRRTPVATVMLWAAEALGSTSARCYQAAGHPALWLTERDGRIPPPADR